MNRTYIQSKIKKNVIVQALHTFYVYCEANFFLKQKSNWSNLQKKELIRILKYAREHCSYYKEILEDAVVSQDNIISILEKMPLLDKGIIREQEKRIYSDEISDNWKFWLNTGGSTGNPLKFPALYKGRHFEMLNQMMLYLKMGYKLGDKIAAVAGNRVTEKNLEKHQYWNFDVNFPYGSLRLSTLYLDNQTVSYYVDELNRMKPDFIRGYPSGIMELCKLSKKNNLSIKYKVKGIYLTSENFSQDEKNIIKDFFGCPVYGQYGHTESSIFAIQLPDESCYYCSPLYGYTEILDENGNHVSEGGRGEVVVTGFTEYGLPFIRYKTGDLAIFGGKNNNGEVIIKALLGRDVDFILDKSGQKKYLVGFIFGGHIHAFDYIQSWQIEQNEIGRIELKIVKSVGYNEIVEQEIKDLFERNNISVKFTYVNKIEKTIRGKQKFLIQNIKGC
jgi:phenylacetate-CoA ligase